MRASGPAAIVIWAKTIRFWTSTRAGLSAIPTEGEAAYRQTSSFNWSDGRSQEQTFLGYMRGERMWFDTATFAGWAWQTGDDIIMLSLDRKDLPGQRFVETILIGEERNRRVRTWHWFDQGVCYKRTLCTETREA